MSRRGGHFDESLFVNMGEEQGDGYLRSAGTSRWPWPVPESRGEVLQVGVSVGAPAGHMLSGGSAGAPAGHIITRSSACHDADSANILQWTRDMGSAAASAVGSAAPASVMGSAIPVSAGIGGSAQLDDGKASQMDLQFHSLGQQEADVHRTQVRLLREVVTSLRADHRALADEVSSLRHACQASLPALQQRTQHLEAVVTATESGFTVLRQRLEVTESGVMTMRQRMEQFESALPERLATSDASLANLREQIEDSLVALKAEVKDCCRQEDKTFSESEIHEELKSLCRQTDLGALRNELWEIRDGLLRESELREESIKRERAQAMAVQDVIAKERAENHRRDHELRAIMGELRVLCVALEGEVRNEVESRLRETRRLWNLLSAGEGSISASAAGTATGCGGIHGGSLPGCGASMSPRAGVDSGLSGQTQNRILGPPVAVQSHA